jgi:hypothetical protein
VIRNNEGYEMARAPILAAGGIVTQRGSARQIAVVRLRKRNEWVLPKGKLDDGETPRAGGLTAARPGPRIKNMVPFSGTDGKPVRGHERARQRH